MFPVTRAPSPVNELFGSEDAIFVSFSKEIWSPALEPELSVPSNTIVLNLYSAKSEKTNPVPVFSSTASSNTKFSFEPVTLSTPPSKLICSKPTRVKFPEPVEPTWPNSKLILEGA